MGAAGAKGTPSPAEIKLMRASWEIVMPQSADFTVGLFIRIFEELSDTQPMFEQLVGKSQSALETDKKMKAHCVRVAGLVNAAVLELEDPETVVEMFVNIARTHYKLGNKLGKTHYDKFGELFVECLGKSLGGSMDAATQKAWTKAFAAAEVNILAAKTQLEGGA